jgi:hypothetical protein
VYRIYEFFFKLYQSEGATVFSRIARDRLFAAFLPRKSGEGSGCVAV